MKLVDVCDIQYGFAFDSNCFNESCGVPIVRIRDVTPGKSETYYSGEYDKQYLVKNKDILVGMDGEFNLNRWNGGDAVLNQRVCKFIPNKDKLLPEYLVYMLPRKLKEIERRTPFVTVKHLSAKEIGKIDLPIPSLSVQHKITSLLEKADSARQKRKEAILLADEFLKSVFIDMFGDPVRNEKGWERGKLSDVPIEIIDGDRGGDYPKQKDFLDDGYCLFLNTKNVTKTGFNFHDLMYVNKEKDNQLRKGKLRRNDLVLTTRGTVGNVAFYDGSVKYENIRINSGMVILRPDIRTFNILYLYGCFSSDYFKRQIGRITSGCAQPQLPIRSLKNIEVIMPPVALQKKYADIMEKIKNLKEKQLQSEKEIDNLFNSLMQRVFGGGGW